MLACLIFCKEIVQKGFINLADPSSMILFIGIILALGFATALIFRAAKTPDEQ